MTAGTGNGQLEHVVDACRMVRPGCEEHLTWLSGPERPRDGALPETIRCVALLALIGDRLADGLPCPLGLIDEAVASARALRPDGSGCANACAAAADLLDEWVDAEYGRA